MPYFQSGTQVPFEEEFAWKIDPSLRVYSPARISCYSYQREAATLSPQDVAVLNAMDQAYADRIRSAIGADYFQISWNLSVYEVTDFVVGVVYPTSSNGATGYEVINRLLQTSLNSILHTIHFTEDVEFWQLGQGAAPPPPYQPPAEKPPVIVPPTYQPPPTPTRRRSIPARIFGRNSLIIVKLGILRNIIVPRQIHEWLHPLI